MENTKLYLLSSVWYFKSDMRFTSNYELSKEPFLKHPYFLQNTIHF